MTASSITWLNRHGNSSVISTGSTREKAEQICLPSVKSNLQIENDLLSLSQRASGKKGTVFREETECSCVSSTAQGLSRNSKGAQSQAKHQVSNTTNCRGRSLHEGYVCFLKRHTACMFLLNCCSCCKLVAVYAPNPKGISTRVLWFSASWNSGHLLCCLNRNQK